MLKNFIALIVVGTLFANCGSNSVDPNNSRNNNQSRPIDGSGNGNVPGTGTKTPILVDVVDDPSLVPFLSGKWGYSSPGNGNKYSTHRFEFSEKSTKFTYTWTYNLYETIYDIQLVKEEHQLWACCELTAGQEVEYKNSISGDRSGSAKEKVMRDKTAVEARKYLLQADKDFSDPV